MTVYSDLIVSEHRERPKFVAAVEASTNAAVDQQAVILAFPSEFDLDSASGSQLDIIGLWVGRSRFVNIPITGVYFAWGTAGVGWGQGYWAGPFDPTEGAAPLPDSIYRNLLRATIALNYWDGTVQAAIDAITPLFPDNSIIVQDNQDMSLTVAVGGAAFDPLMASLLTGGYLALKPAGVRVIFLFTSLPPLPLFGFGADNAFIGGWGRGAWGVSQPVVLS